MVQNQALRRWDDIQSSDNQTLLQLYAQSSLYLDDEAVCRVRQIASDAVIKFGFIYSFEPFTMDFVRDTTNIPVPKPLHYAHFDGQGLLVMERVAGRTLDNCWNDLSLFKKIKVAWTLRQYIKKIRSPPVVARPGPLGPNPEECVGRFFTDLNAGPFETYQELIDWLNHKRDVVVRMKKAPASIPILDTSAPLVFTHGDLRPHNIMLNDQDRVWLIDWGCSGVYPRWLEYGSMSYWWEKLQFGRLVVLLVAGYYPRERRFLDSIFWALDVGYLM